MEHRIEKVRGEDRIAEVRELVWEFFDVMRERYPEMLKETEAYIENQNVAGELADFSQYFLPPNGESFVALLDGAPVGIVMLKPRGENDGEMNRMYVRAEARGHGMGRSLGEAVVAEARSLGFGTLWCDALYRHIEALPLYESLGFQRYTDPDAFHGDDARVIHMKMKLQ